MIEKDQINKLILGGLLINNKASVSLRRIQIEEGFRIHTCNNYGESLETIKLASKGIEKKLKLLTKVYYRYPNLKHTRNRTLIEQLDEIVYRLDFVPYDWSIQICCYCNLSKLRSPKAQQFFHKIKKKYSIGKVYFEYYPVYKYKFSDIANLNNFYNTQGISFGLIGYQNLLNRVFSHNDIDYLSSKSISICFLGILGKGKQNKKFSNCFAEDKEKIDGIDQNIYYYLSFMRKYGNIEAITQVSTLEHFKDLKKRITKIKRNFENKKFLDYLKNKSDNFYHYQNYDQYGGYITYKQYIKNPKLVFSKIKFYIISFINSVKFKNNYFG